jgi:hypothetical protein
MGLTSGFGFKATSPLTHEELREWVNDGLIPDFSDDTSLDVVVHNALRAARLRLRDQAE